MMETYSVLVGLQGHKRFGAEGILGIGIAPEGPDKSPLRAGFWLAFRT